MPVCSSPSARSLSEVCGKRFNLLLQTCDSCFLFLVLAMFLEELIEQHGIYLIVADAIGFSILVAHDQVGIHLFHVLGH